MLYDLIDEEKELIYIVSGHFGPDLSQAQLRLGSTLHSGIIVATDRRVIMVDKGILSTEVAEMPYSSVEAITHSTGIFAGGLRITGRGGLAFRIENVRPKTEAKVFADCVRDEVESHRPRRRRRRY